MKLVLGLGSTGAACIHYLCQKGETVCGVDDSLTPPGLARIHAEHPEVATALGTAVPDAWWMEIDLAVVSPGIAPTHPVMQLLRAKQIPIVGDIELFAREVHKPVIGITGSNGKTTVTTLVGYMLERAGLSVAVCGNIGIPVLDRLSESVDVYVLELSSFQLDTTESLRLTAGVVLNVSPDHLDRYDTYADYVASKRRIYRHCDRPVVNADETDIWKNTVVQTAQKLSFSVQHQQADFYVLEKETNPTLCFRGESLLKASEMHLQGMHHWQNALAALALCYAMGVPFPPLLSALRDFQGLPHRCTFVRSRDNVLFFDDSKGTNVGATIAAMRTVAERISGRVLLIAGGLGKGADFSVLRAAVLAHVSHVFVMGTDAPLIQTALSDLVPIHPVMSMEAAVMQAAELAQSGDAVLLSPACASFDMFRDYGHRGDVFQTCVKDLP